MKNKEQLIEELTELIKSQNYNEKELESVEWLEELFLMNKSVDFLLENYVNIITEYTFHMVNYEETEEYEMCDLLNKGIRILTNDTLRMLNVHYISPTEIIEEINEIPTFLYNIMKEKLNDYGTI